MGISNPPAITITLTVDADNLYKLGDPKITPIKQGKIQKCCKLTDDNNGSNPVPTSGKKTIVTFESDAYLGGIITWQGPVDKTPGYAVAITKITCNTFMGDISKPADSNGIVTITVNNLPALTNQIGEYTIYFDVTNTLTNHVQSYSIDPKIKLNPPPKT